MTFQEPRMFWLLAVLLPLVLALEVRALWRGPVFRLSSETVLPAPRRSWSVLARILIIGLKLLAISCLVAALARPQRTVSAEEDRTSGIQIMLCLDVSKTMSAEDFKPDNRLQAAKKVLADFIKGDQGDRIGLVVFAGVSFTQCPLTLDHDILLDLLDRVEIEGTVLADGTAVGSAVINAVNALDTEKGKSKVIILATDGINNSGVDPLSAARLAATKGIVVYTIGIGRQGGAPMVFVRGGRRITVTDPMTGRPVMSGEPDETLLTALATMTGGQYFRATDSGKLGEIYHRIGMMTREEFKRKRTVQFQDAPLPFLIAGLILLLTEWVLAGTVFRIAPA